MSDPNHESERIDATIPPPSAYELIRIAMLLRPDAIRTSADETTRERWLSEAFSLWKVARRILENRGATTDELEYGAMLADVVTEEARNEAIAAATAEPEKVVAWTDAQLWAGVSEGLRTRTETPSQVAERLHKKFIARLKSDGRESEIQPRSAGVKFGFAVEYLKAPRKPGPKPTPGSNQAADGNVPEETAGTRNDLASSETNSKNESAT